MQIRVAAKRLRSEATLPGYATRGAAGLDLHACLEGPMRISPGSITLVPTGLALAIPAGHVGLVRDRSGLALAGLHTVAGVIDSDYRGEIMVAVHNGGGSALEVRPGERIAQILVLPCPPVLIQEVADLPPTERGAGGFGSTGR